MNEFDLHSITEPPLTKDLSNLKLQELIYTPLEVSPYPFYSQAVERHI